METHKSGIELCLKQVFHDGISVLVSQEYLEGLNYGSEVDVMAVIIELRKPGMKGNGQQLDTFH